jgi:hypothetical protein
MMRVAITTPEVLKSLQARESKLPYRDRAKPFNFVLMPIIDTIEEIKRALRELMC